MFISSEKVVPLCLNKHAMMILLAWGIFICLVYLMLWGDSFYYRYNLPKVCKKVLDAFTEEE